eukprot:CAMPEP_0115256788 /NCGR_PEP_ID=MMETSP0270-20121206/46431_1 /TAXON_ID=71861 /ORGANISM="Scrippsiella trochoidea, Strain CCMP3099" /LENGTH=140 /DNA_ID=CAMNT_0002672461 /DNA_START=737 /DNA_END=1160 /DNA_ORIENTATION=+
MVVNPGDEWQRPRAEALQDQRSSVCNSLRRIPSTGTCRGIVNKDQHLKILLGVGIAIHRVKRTAARGAPHAGSGMRTALKYLTKKSADASGSVEKKVVPHVDSDGSSGVEGSDGARRVRPSGSDLRVLMKDSLCSKATGH